MSASTSSSARSQRLSASRTSAASMRPLASRSASPKDSRTDAAPWNQHVDAFAESGIWKQSHLDRALWHVFGSLNTCMPAACILLQSRQHFEGIPLVVTP